MVTPGHSLAPQHHWIVFFCRRRQCWYWCPCFPAPCNPQRHWSANSTEIRLRISDPRFDCECREAKRVVRHLEEVALKTQSGSDVVEWRAHQRVYRKILRPKRYCHWKVIIENCKSSRQMWRSLNGIMGRGKDPCLFNQCQRFCA